MSLAPSGRFVLRGRQAGRQRGRLPSAHELFWRTRSKYSFMPPLSMLRGVFPLAFIVAAQILPVFARPLDLYWVDVEGGAATLIITPAGESVLIDTGNP